MQRSILMIVLLIQSQLSCDVFAQSQVQVTQFHQSSSDVETPAKKRDNKIKCPVPSSSADIFFTMSNNGTDTDIKFDELDKQIRLWDMQLEKVDENLDPFFCCYTSTLIDNIVERIATVIGDKRAVAIAVFDPNTAADKTTELKKLRQYQKDLEKRSKIFFGINRIHGNPRWFYRFFPASNREYSAIIYQKYSASLTQVGTNISIYGWQNRGTINPELISTYFGPFRFAVNTLLTSTDSSLDITEEVQLRTLTGNGGNFVVSFYYPIYHYSNAWFTSLFQFAPKFATELPVLNSPFDGSTVYSNGNLGLEFSASVRLGDILGGANLYLYVRPSYIFSSRAYKAALNVDNNFWLFQPVVGLDIPYLGRFGFNFPVASNVESLASNSYLVSFTVTPQNIIKR